MFTHPSLLRSLLLTSDFLRRSGEARWARDLKALGDRIRKWGWTQDSKADLDAVFTAEPSLWRVSFGAEHERWLHGEKGVRLANEKLADMCAELRELSQVPLVDPASSGPRKRSPDLEPL